MELHEDFRENMFYKLVELSVEMAGRLGDMRAVFQNPVEVNGLAVDNWVADADMLLADMTIQLRQLKVRLQAAFAEGGDE